MSKESVAVVTVILGHSINFVQIEHNKINEINGDITRIVINEKASKIVYEQARGI